MFSIFHTSYDMSIFYFYLIFDKWNRDVFKVSELMLLLISKQKEIAVKKYLNQNLFLSHSIYNTQYSNSNNKKHNYIFQEYHRLILYLDLKLKSTYIFYIQ